jgi:hypothetical protein
MRELRDSQRTVQKLLKTNNYEQAYACIAYVT